MVAGPASDGNPIQPIQVSQLLEIKEKKKDNENDAPARSQAAQMSVSGKRNDHKPHPYTTTNTAQHLISYHLSIEELPSTLEEEGRYGFQPSSPSADSYEDEVVDEYTYEYDDGGHAGDVPWRPRAKEWLVLICVSIVALMDAYNATVIVPLVPVRKSFLFTPPAFSF